MSDPNAGLKSALKHYVRLTEPPGYAVLVTGPWGVGKTFVVRGCLDQELEKDGYRYVSLFGVESKSDIDLAVFKAVYPRLSGTTAQVAGGVFRSVSKFVGVDADISLQKVMNIVREGVYVFDDLERARLNISVILGYLNEFIEHDGCRVILIGHTEKVDKKKSFERQREKLIGRTVQVVSDVDTALGHFLKRIGNEDVRRFLQQRADRIKAIYADAAIDNLRILQQALWDSERFYLSLDGRHRAESEAVDALFDVFLALALETKSGQVCRSDLALRAESSLRALLRSGDDSNQEPDPYGEAEARHPGINLHDPLLSNDLLVAMLFDGVFDAAAVAESLDQHPPFVPPEKQAPLWTLARGPFQSDGALQSAVTRLDHAMAEREITTRTEILQLYLTRRWLASFDMIRSEDVAQDLITYIDDLHRHERLPATGTENWEVLPSSPRDPGMGFGENLPADDGFCRVYAHLRRRCREAHEAWLDRQATCLLNALATDAEEFARRIETGGPYGKVPILALIEPSGFADAFLRLGPESQESVVFALGRRFRYGERGDEFARERDWLRSVRDQLMVGRGQTFGFAAERLRIVVERFIDRILRESSPAN